MTILTTQEVAAKLDCSARTVRNWCETGLLPARYVGRMWIIRAEALVDFTPPKRGRPPRKTK